jgi:V/A-type H+/Na+-transporting ATPase subunit D
MADQIIEGTHPTRMELLHIKNRLRLARKGHRLLRQKRDTLLIEFMNMARAASSVGEEASTQLERARHAYAVAAAIDGPSQLASQALAGGPEAEFDFEYRNVMGVRLPTLSVRGALRGIDGRGVGIISSTPSADLAASEYERSVESLTRLAQTEQSLLAMSGEVKRTKRRVNALEYKLIPLLEGTQKHIRMRLEELEREGFFRRKLIKRKRAAK